MERPFAHQFVTGGLRRIFVRGHANVRKRLLIHVCGFNLGLLMRHLTGVGTPRSLQSRAWTRLFTGYLGPNGALDSPESPLGALLGVDPARFAVLRSWNPSLGHLNASVRKEHKPEKSGFCHGLLSHIPNSNAGKYHNN